MKKLLLTALILGGCILIPNRASAWGWGKYKIEAGAFFRAYPIGYAQPYQLGPWYNYWPLEAHFQQPAPLAYPPYAGPMSLPPSFGQSSYGATGYPAPGAYTSPAMIPPKQ